MRNLTKEFTRKQGLFGAATAVRAVDDVTFDVAEGETFGLVGESGQRQDDDRPLHPAADRADVRRGADSAARTCSPSRRARMRQARREMQIVFQDPYSSLNPRMRVGTIVEEPLVIHRHRDARPNGRPACASCSSSSASIRRS